jgi:endo-alpha-1,4-polygalactosaminidase (GH114 family)
MTACTDYKPVGDTTSDLSLEVIHRNGIVANIWMHEESRFDVLRKNNMRYLFIDVGNTGEDGKLTTPRSEIREFLTRLNKYEKENGYAFTLFAYSEINTDNYNVDNNFLDNFIQDYKQLITDGFDGVLVDIEPVKIEERENYIKFLKNLRKNISEN